MSLFKKAMPSCYFEEPVVYKTTGLGALVGATIMLVTQIPKIIDTAAKIQTGLESGMKLYENVKEVNDDVK